jgi:hypothetical protein
MEILWWSGDAVLKWQQPSRYRQRLIKNDDFFSTAGRATTTSNSYRRFYSLFLGNGQDKRETATTYMDYSLFRTVYEVQAFVAQVPTDVHNLLPLPWKGGRRSFILDEAKVQVLLDASANNRKGVITPNSALNPATLSSTTSPSPSLDGASTNLTPCFDEQNQIDKGHVLIPYGDMVDWISSTMNCRHCYHTVKPSCIKKTMIGIATSLHFSCDSKKCAKNVRKTMEAKTVPSLPGAIPRNPCSAARFASNWRLLH